MSIGHLSATPPIPASGARFTTKALENIANIGLPVIAVIEGRAHIHSDYALLANVIVAAEGATFQDVGHYAAGVTPGDGIFTTWSYRAGAGRAEAFLSTHSR
jgi:enoyl-CoA hydratase/carnithine racemase